ncbi:unnamed protein product [Durusdinium trenchii]|uniref:Uncharacterized protein n=1 Tax=Durusdinium trenchii TaxID=1381693 RepID=A0ABP0M876_9DINO
MMTTMVIGGSMVTPSAVETLQKQDGKVLSVKKQMHFFDGARAHEVRSRWFYPKNGFVNRRAELPERRVSLAQADLSTCPVSQATGLRWGVEGWISMGHTWDCQSGLPRNDQVPG